MTEFMDCCSPCSSPHPVLPPIIKNERDRIFLQQLYKHIDHELRKIDETVPEEKYIVHKDAFDRLINHVVAYKPILTAIKAEYEDCIDTIIRGKREAFYLNGKLKAMSSEPTTRRNYKKRIDELEGRINIVKENNYRLSNELTNMRKTKEENGKKIKKTDERPKRELKKDRRQIPGLSLEENMDLTVLDRELNNVKKQLKELKHAEMAKYQPRHIKDSLKVQLASKTDQRDQMVIDEETARAKRDRLKVALEAAQAYNKMETYHLTIGDAVVDAIQKHGKQKKAGIKQTSQEDKDGNMGHQHDGTAASAHTDDVDDPVREREHEIIVDYIDKFNELFDDKKYEAAAIHAANSPRGILRNMDTLERFRAVKPASGQRIPLLAYCDAIMSSVLALNAVPNEAMSRECVKCALDNNRLDMLSHWVSQDRLKVSEDLGDMIVERCFCKNLCTCGCQAMAQKIYTAVGSHKKVVLCMLRQGRVVNGVEYAHQKTELTLDDYQEFLIRCPSPQLASILVIEDGDGTRILPVGFVVTTLLKTNLYQVGLQLVDEIRRSGSGTDNLNRAVLEDYVTTEKEWLTIVHQLERSDYKEASMELLAAVTVVGAMKMAAAIMGSANSGNF